MKRLLLFLSGLPLFCISGAPAPGAVLVTELMYNPPQGDDVEYVEIHNDGAEPADIGGWSFTAGVELIFPEGTRLAPGAYAVVCRSAAALRKAYPDVPADRILGEYVKALSNNGETITLRDAGRRIVESFRYDDSPPWDFLADGFGASLERICLGDGAGLPENWRSSGVPDDPERSTGSPGNANRAGACPPSPPAPSPLRISEIHYHPVLEQSLEDEHEFVEIFNAGKVAIPLAGHRIAGGIDFRFPEGASIQPGEFKVIARNRQLLAAVARYGLAEVDLLGNYSRTLDNGGDKVAIIGPSGEGIDAVSFDDDFPWPIGADALGADERFLNAALLPLESHQYLGHSLERVSFEIPSGEVSNWAPSPLDGPTPGKPNASARAEPLPIAVLLTAQPRGGEGEIIRSGQETLIQAIFQPRPPSGGIQVEYFLDDLTRTDEPVLAEALRDDGQAGDATPGDGLYTAILPAQADNSIVRYRIQADLGSGMERLSPRSTDPNPWRAYFVSPVVNSQSRLYQMFIPPVNWTRLWTNIQGGRVRGCALNPGWDAEEPAVLVHDGKVYDISVRYQGSRYNRTNGPGLNRWTVPGPTAPRPLVALSWHVTFPSYNQMDGRSAFILNKNTQGCPGYNAGVGYRLAEMADLPGSQSRFIRFHINGGYYHYMVEYERPGEDMMRRYHSDMAKKYPDRPKEKVGHLFKSSGCNCDEGPYGWGDERKLPRFCNYTEEQRYAATYDRKTHGWDSHAEFKNMIDGLDAARRGGIDAMRQFLADRFDLELLLNYVAFMNYAVPFDDMFQNHYLYQRLSDGRWMPFAWDIDQNYGEWKGPTASFYMGAQNDPDNRSAWWNYLKDTVLKAYREEFEERLILFNNTIFHPDAISGWIDKVTAAANPAEAAQSPAGLACSFPSRAASFRSFAAARYALINSKLAGVIVNAGPDRTAYAGSPVQFDATASKPDPGPETEYSWDNGMEGDAPTFTWQEPGVYKVTLTLVSNGLPFEDSVTVNILPRPPQAFREQNGSVTFEAEHYDSNDLHGAVNNLWIEDDSRPGFSGPTAMLAKEIKRQTYTAGYSKSSPELRYPILFQTPGSYRVWIRGLSETQSSDTCYAGLNGGERSVRFAQQFQIDPAQYLWSGDTSNEGPQVLAIPQPGLYYLSVWVRESKQVIDKIHLDLDAGAAPQGAGPDESGRAPLGGGVPFRRGDPDGDGKINVGDAVAIIGRLFRGQLAGACEDALDVDDNGAMEIADAVRLLLYLFARGAPPAPPFPEAGLDPTPDAWSCGGP